MRTAIRTAASVSSSVRSARSRMASVTGLRREIQLPRCAPWLRAQPPPSRTRWSASLSRFSCPAAGAAATRASTPIATSLMAGLPSLSARGPEPHVPEVQLRRGPEAPQLLARDLERKVVPELDPADVLVEEELDLVPHRLPLPGVGLSGHGVQPALLVLVAPPPGPVALHARVVPRLGIERDPGGEGVPQLGLVAPLDERRPVDDLQVDPETDRLQLLLGDHRLLVHPLG